MVPSSLVGPLEPRTPGTTTRNDMVNDLYPSTCSRVFGVNKIEETFYTTVYPIICNTMNFYLYDVSERFYEKDVPFETGLLVPDTTGW